MAFSGWLERLCDWTYCSSGTILIFLGKAIPHASEDINIIGEVTPTALAAIMVVFAPRDEFQRKFILIYAALFCLIYSLYLHFTVFLVSQSAMGLIANNLDDAEYTTETLLNSLRSFASSIRLFSIVVASALIGLWLQLKIRHAQ